MQWLYRLIAFIASLLLTVAVYAAATARYAEQRVGFQLRQAIDLDGRSIKIGIWYPSSDRNWPTTLLGAQLISVARQGAVAGQGLPLVVLSHGNGGGISSHVDLAMDLASAGYVVAAVMHPGDNYLDQRDAGAATLFSNRARQLRLTLDYLLQDWPEAQRLDPTRIGAFGFSAGGFSVLTLLGAKPDFARLAGHCATTPEFICGLLQQLKSPLLPGDSADVGEFVADPRIRAAVLAAPGLGFVFDPQALRAVSTPIQLWSGGADDTVPFASNAQHIRDGIPRLVELHEVVGAGHTAFLAPCGLLKPAALCSDGPGFDRAVFHREMNARVIEFLNIHLGANGA